MRTPYHRLSSVFAAMVVVFVAACGGGGSSSVSPDNTPPPPPVPTPTGAQLAAASKVASHATFGLAYDDIYALAVAGRQAWLDQQFALGPTLHKPVVDTLMQMLDNNELPAVDDPVEHLIMFRRYAWWNRAMTAPDVLRQRVAFALSEILVVSDNVDALIVYPYALSTYYDVLLAHAFGNYRDLLENVALHPAMGMYLSHVNNAKANPGNNTFPDENFARELMQLFSIGLFELNNDGSVQLGVNGQPIPTYDNEDVREMAKIFTGLSYGGEGAFFGNPQPFFQVDMQMFEAAHELGEKRLLNGLVIGAGQTGMQDIQDALDNLFNHPNVGPFIGKQLIQRLVTSNPSPAYISRIASTFNGAGTGIRGDMQATIAAILGDPEATNISSSIAAGRLREPLVRFVSMARQLNATAEDGLFYNNGFLQQFALRQHPLSSPSVFNFFLPSHSPTGEIADARLQAPEFQITDASTIISMSNLVDFAVSADFVMDIQEPFGDVSLNFSEFVTLAQQGVEPLLDRLDLVFTHGQLSVTTRGVIAAILADINDPEFQARTAIYLILISPDYAVDA